MTIDSFLDYFSMYGYYFLFLIVFLEYLNLPGLPAGVIMPAAGILISQADMTFMTALVISVIAGILGSFVLYGIGYYVGNPAVHWMTTKFPKTQKPIDQTIGYIEKHGNKSIFLGRLLPVIRTIIALPAGAFKMKFIPFTLYSIGGITIWNAVYIFAGYAFGDWFLS